jgi:hypothetical protein
MAEYEYVTSIDLNTAGRKALIEWLKANDAYTGHSRDGLDALRTHALATRRVIAATVAAAADATDAEVTAALVPSTRKAPKAGAIDRAVVDGLLDGTISDHPMKATLAAVSARQDEARAKAVPDPDTDPAWATDEVYPEGTDEPVVRCDRCGEPLTADHTEGTCTAPVVADDRAERLALAKAEHQALTAWNAAGQEGEKPATPNLDAMNEAFAAGTPLRSKRVRKQGAGRTTAPRRAQANEIARKGARGPGRRVDDTELTSYIAGVVAENPEARMEDELEFAYWVEQLAVSRKRFYAAWADVQADPECVRVAGGEQ